MEHHNLIAGPPATYLPEDEEATAELAATGDPAAAAARSPPFLGARAGPAVARTGAHRGLDQLRQAGGKGHGPIPWEYEANRGFLRSLPALGRAADAIGEDDEALRCRTFLRESSASAAAQLKGS